MAAASTVAADLVAGVELLCLDAGNTVIVVEHNVDVVRECDWIVDIGPEGGAAGGQVVAEGTPEAVAGVRTSHTGKFLRGALGL